MSFSYFYLPNSIFDLKLNNSDFAVAAYLYSLYNPNKKNSYGFCVKVKQKTIAEACGISKETVARSVSRLMELGIITKRIRTVKTNRHLGTYTYVIGSPRTFRHFRISRTVFKKLGSGSVFRVYAYCCKCADTKNSLFFHSYSDIASALGMKRSEVIAHIKVLCDGGFLVKKRKVTRQGDFTENTYQCVFQKHHNVKIAHLFEIVKSFSKKIIKNAAKFKKRAESVVLTLKGRVYFDDS